MRSVATTFFLLFLVSSSFCFDLAGKIKHVIVVMEENRSFDHMLGFFPGVDGLKGNECNYVNSSDHTSKKVCISKDAPYENPCDPDHGTPATTWKIFGGAAAQKGDLTNATMSGFVEWEEKRGVNRVNFCDVMNVMTPDRVPIMSTLASEYAVFDRFFCSHPGPTWPNRLYALSGTSAGLTETGTWYQGKYGQLFPQKTFFDQIAEEGLTWKHYFNDTCWELFVSSIAHNPEHLESMESFYEDARKGTLPNYAWINPRSGFNITLMQGSNDQHPDHDVALGEAYYKDIYEALRASPQWNETLLIITYDEHGGFYDHVPPPLHGIPAPEDGEVSYPDSNFHFDRLGIRIPTLLISPWIPKGLVLSEPPKSSRPTPTSEYDLTSIMASVRKLFNMKSGPLTKRDAWAATFDQAFDILKEPRTDCPEHLPSAPPPAAFYDPKKEMEFPVNDLQKHIMTIHAHLAGVPYPEHIQKQGQVSEWLQEHFNIHKEKTLDWKKSKFPSDAFLGLRLNNPAGQFLARGWVINKEAGIDYYTIATRNVTPAWCVDFGTGVPTEGTRVNFAQCYPSPIPHENRDVAQHWIWADDSTIRPAKFPSLCVTGAVLGEKPSDKLTLRRCSEKNPEQYFAWHGDSDNDYSAGGIVMSEWGLGIINATAPHN